MSIALGCELQCLVLRGRGGGSGEPSALACEFGAQRRSRHAVKVEGWVELAEDAEFEVGEGVTIDDREDEIRGVLARQFSVTPAMRAELLENGTPR
jgi:hypothetical protein